MSWWPRIANSELYPLAWLADNLNLLISSFSDRVHPKRRVKYEASTIPWYLELLILGSFYELIAQHH